ncbi:hypothetical protein M0805_004187 [Coniferiporia weirii]|nr:hypothetical protein M0805_004187 [Coniferiporia weirii]
MKSLSATQEAHILSLLNAGQSSRQIASSTGVHYSTVSRLRSKHCPGLKKATGGCSSKLSPANMHYATHLITSGKAENAVQVARILRTITNGSVSDETVRNCLKGAGMKAVVKKKRPILSKRHRKEQLDFASAHKDWTLEDWKKVVWSDETKVNRLGSDGKKWAWKQSGQGLSDRLVEGTLKFGGGSIMIWGCMLWEGTGLACKIDGRMDGELYTQILEDELQDSLVLRSKDRGAVRVTDASQAESVGRDDEVSNEDSDDDVLREAHTISMSVLGRVTTESTLNSRDNDPKHTCKRAIAWFKDHGFEVLQWPAQSPDLNPIEHLWDHLKKRLGGYERAPSGILELWERIQKEWNDIGASVCQGLIESMPRRVEAVIKAKGGYTVY